MGTVTVYEYEVFDRKSRLWVKAARMGTLEAISSEDGVALMATGLVVDEGRVDSRGFIVPARHE